jgi:hypothetical protein
MVRFSCPPGSAEEGVNVTIDGFRTYTKRFPRREILAGATPRSMPARCGAEIRMYEYGTALKTGFDLFEARRPGVQERTDAPLALGVNLSLSKA